MVNIALSILLVAVALSGPSHSLLLPASQSGSTAQSPAVFAVGTKRGS